jgi:hypothetical protein
MGVHSTNPSLLGAEIPASYQEERSPQKISCLGKMPWRRIEGACRNKQLLAAFVEKRQARPALRAKDLSERFTYSAPESHFTSAGAA